MSLLAFESLVQLPGVLVYLLALLVLVLGAAAAGAAGRRLTLDVLLAPWGGRAWGALAWALGTAVVWKAVSPVLPARVFGVVYWPAHAALPVALARCASVGAWAAALQAAVLLAGGFDGWRPRPLDGAGLRRVAGAWAAGVVGASFFAAAARALFVGEAFSRLGFGVLGGVVVWLAAPAAALAAGAVVWLAAGCEDWDPRWRAAAAAGLLAAGLLPVAGAEVTLRAVWDFGRAGLSDAAGVPTADKAERVAVLVLSEPDGSPGTAAREETLAAEGLAVTREGLSAVRRYLELQRYHTVFLRQALGYLRKGWALMWEPEKHMDAALVRLGPRFPPDYDAFLKAILVAPATTDNYGRLENMSRAAQTAHSPSVKKAGRLYQGLSDAYARFGDLEASNYWLKRIRKLWPLYEEDVNVDPIEDRHDGTVRGEVTYNGRAASAVQVGLFMQVSTAAAPSARDGLVASAWPDENGRFEFRELTPGRYYLALRADPVLLGGRRVEALGAPGVFRLSSARMEWELMPVRLERVPSFPAEAPFSLPPAGAVPIPLPR